MSYSRLFISVAIILIILGTGTIYFHNTEGWNLTDSFYFTGMTMTTVGYGDLVPKSDQTKIFTVIFSLVTIGACLYALTVIGEELFKKRAENMLSFFKKNGKTKKRNPQTTLFSHGKK